jgi:hypothetical protein
LECDGKPAPAGATPLWSWRGAPSPKAPSPLTLCRRTPKAADTTALEREIGQRVHRLYGLTAEEIKLVEKEGQP